MAEWKPVSPDEVKAWRSKLPKGWTREVAVGRTEGLEQVGSEGDTAIVDRPSPNRLREPRDTVDAVAKQLLDWARMDRETFVAKIRMLRAAHPEMLSHLSDEEAGEQLHDVLLKVARASAEEQYRVKGWDKGVTIHGDPSGTG